MVQIEAVPLASPQSAHLLLSDNDFTGSQPTQTNVMPALEPYAKAPRHPILENLQPEHPVAGTSSW